ncbi:peptide-methionine (S)-S-oxide reductase MsrA [Leptospira jelokensis]|nr:peptide-methionine (S)-S-oxide reductase MsrA [Leptospira jelokensis]
MMTRKSTKQTKTQFLFAFILFYVSLFGNCGFGAKGNAETKQIPLVPKSGQKMAVFAEGCFWCSEHIFESIPGVLDVVSGYAGGHTENPTYDSVNTETTGHAESVLVVYDPTKINYEELCRVFFLSHDPTTIDRQGPDVGSSYRSILFYQTEEEFQIAKRIKIEIESKKIWDAPIVTEIKPIAKFYQAEGYHQDFIKHNPNQSYVQAVSLPRYFEFQKRYEKYKRN